MNNGEPSSTAAAGKPGGAFVGVVDQQYSGVRRQIQSGGLRCKAANGVAVGVFLILPGIDLVVADAVEVDPAAADGAAARAVCDGYAAGPDVDHACSADDFYAILGDLHLFPRQGFMPDRQSRSGVPLQKVGGGLGCILYGCIVGGLVVRQIFVGSGQVLICFVEVQVRLVQVFVGVCQVFIGLAKIFVGVLDL